MKISYLAKSDIRVTQNSDDFVSCSMSHIADQSMSHVNRVAIYLHLLNCSPFLQCHKYLITYNWVAQFNGLDSSKNISK